MARLRYPATSALPPLLEDQQTSPKSAKIEPIGPEFPETVSLALVPLHSRGTRCHGVVVPLESQRLLAEYVGLEASPSLDLEVVERAAVGTKPMRYARGKIHKRAGLEFLGRISNLDHAMRPFP